MCRPPVSSDRAWASSERVAQLVANVIGGIFVIVGLSSYVATVIAKALSVAPTMSEFFVAHIRDAIALTHVEQGLPACWSLSRASGMVAFAECLGLLRALGSDEEQDTPSRIRVSNAGTAIGVILLASFVVTKYKWIGWYCWLQFVVVIQWFIALYQVLRVTLSMTAYFSVKLIKIVASATRAVRVMVFGLRTKHAAALRQLMKNARSYPEWFNMAQYLDELEGKNDWKSKVSAEDHDHCDFYQLNKNTQELAAAIESKNIDALKYILTTFVMRNKLGIDSADLHLESNTGTKHVIERYNAQVIRALEFLANADEQLFPAHEKTVFFRKLKQSFGSTALCLSGGGAIAMYHMGVIKALLHADLLPNVISGSSGGSIAAAMTACKTNQELLETVIHRDISTQYFHFDIRWFPPLLHQLAHCVKTGFLVECSDFERTTKHYYGEPMDARDKMMHYTFQDAFLKTGRHVCITVSASDVTGHKGPKKLLLNHINTPHVLLWSAVAVSCSLPGIMKGKKLMARDHNGNIVPYDAMGKEWVDGSIQHDLPMETMASCFNVTNFIVSQVNPHVVPFVGDDVHKPTFRKSLFHTLESVIAADVRHRLKMLAFLGLFPKIYGHQFSSYFKQNFSGNVTLIPDFVFLEAIGVKAILNPTKEDMDRYILGGQRAVWPKLAYIGHLCAIEKCLDRCLEPLLGAKLVRYENWLHPESKEKETWCRQGSASALAYAH
ncbi:hypothetical protein PINS_up002149 [Pythium insidiosum]|nr:hypothetical protein PINS_up002149 [Pythium insidiosum]